MARECEPLGYQIVISNSDEKAEIEARQIELLLDRCVDGLIVASAQTNGRGEAFRGFRNRKIPCVFIDRVPAGSSMTRRSPKDCAHSRAGRFDRHRAGYRRALAKYGLEAAAGYVVTGHHDDASGYEAMRELLRLIPPPDGVFCYNDPVAAGAIKAILEAGLSVPMDVTVIGTGNVHYSDLLRVPLSAELLVECVESKTIRRPRHIWIPARLVVRESTRRS